MLTIDKEYLEWAVSHANTFRWRGTFYSLFCPGFGEYSEFHYGEQAPEDVMRRLKAILTETPPMQVNLHPPKEDTQVWLVGATTYISFTASQLSEGFERARIIRWKWLSPTLKPSHYTEKQVHMSKWIEGAIRERD